MLTVHHLGKSQSERVVWLCEELGIPYELKRYDRDPATILAPAEYRVLHPLGAAPVIADGDLERLTKPVLARCGRHGPSPRSRRPLGGGGAVAAARAAEAEGRTPALAGPGRPDRHPVRAQVRGAVGDAARRDGLRLGHVVLAAAARLAQGRGVGRPSPGLAGAAARGRATGLAAGRAGQRQRAREKGGEATGPSPTDRGKPGTKRHLVVDGRGTPLGLTLSAANRHDSRMLAPTLDAVPPIRSGRRGRPRRRPGKLHADKGHDHREDIHLAFATLGCALVCLNQIRRLC